MSLRNIPFGLVGKHLMLVCLFLPILATNKIFRRYLRCRTLTCLLKGQEMSSSPFS